MGWACLGVLGLLGPLVQSALSAEHMLGASFCCWSWGSGDHTHCQGFLPPGTQTSE